MAISLLAIFAGVTPTLAQSATTSGAPEESSPKEHGIGASLTPQFTEGKYGTNTRTEVLYVPLQLEWDLTDRFSVDLTVPYVWQHGQGVLSTLGVGPHRPRAGGVRARRLGRAGRLAAQAPVTTADGLGDILFEGDYVLLDDQVWVPQVTGLAEIKFPTADERKGLGTGEFDELVGIDVSKKLGSRWRALLDLAYTFVGSPRNVPLNNSYSWLLGARYDLTSTLQISANLEGATAIARGEKDPLDVRLAAGYDLTRHIRLTGGVLRGLSHGAPDWGVSAGLGVRF